MLRQPVRLRIFPINIHLSAVDGGIYVRVAVDADEVIGGPLVRQPHAGEFARLSGKPDATAADAAQFAQDDRCIVLYKGHRTRIFTPDGAAYRNTSGNPGMAKGGSGDVLAGMLVSLCGQGIDAVPAACTAAWLHGRAGDLAANALSEYGMTPSDMLTQLPILLKRYNSKTW